MIQIATPVLAPTEVPPLQWEAATQGAALHDLGLHDRIVAVGADRASFLQALLTCDIVNAQPGTTFTGCLCDIKGRVQVATRIWKREEEIWLFTEPGQGPTLIEGLTPYRLRSKVWLVSRTNDTFHLAIIGPKAQEFSKHAGFDDRTHGFRAITLRDDSSDDGGPGWEVLYGIDPLFGSPVLIGEQKDKDSVQSLLIRMGCVEVDEACAEAFRVEAGLPRPLRELTNGHLPLEGGYKNSISFEKGCYLGQEIVCRVDSRGAPPTELWEFQGHGEDPPSPGSSLTQGSLRATITSVMRRNETIRCMAHVPKSTPNGDFFDESGHTYQPIAPIVMNF